MKVEVDKFSGFCGGVIRAINRAEGFLQENPGLNLYSLGAIVHNDAELERLRSLGLTTIDYDDLSQVHDGTGQTLLIRAHGEPPATYLQAEALGFEIVDCTCPVVLDLQRSIREAYDRCSKEGKGGQIIIFGQIGHAETLGLMGQVNGAIVVQTLAMLTQKVEDGHLDLKCPIEIFSQTTKSPSEYSTVCTYLENSMAEARGIDVEAFRAMDELRIHNTICTQVATRQTRLMDFAAHHDVIIFVSGKASSNGKVLSSLCKKTNIRTYHIESADELKAEWFRADDNVGICGATSTPRWLLEGIADKVLEIGEIFPNFALEKQ